MQTSALYDPIRSASPLQRKEIEKFHQRRSRIEAAGIKAALASDPIDKTERSKAPAEPPLKVRYEQMWFYDLVSFAETWVPGMPAVKRRLRIDQIQKAVAQFYGVTVLDMVSARRTASIVRPRQIGYFLSKNLTVQSLPEIGRRFGNRDHTSALHGIRKIERLRETDPKLDQELRAIANDLGASLA